MKQGNKNIERVDRGWEKMSVVLEQKMPQKKKRRYGFWLFCFGIGLGLLTIYLTYGSQDKTQIPATSENSNMNLVNSYQDNINQSLETKEITTETKEKNVLTVTQENTVIRKDDLAKAKVELKETKIAADQLSEKLIIKNSSKRTKQNLKNSTKPNNDTQYTSPSIVEHNQKTSRNNSDKVLTTQLLPTKNVIILKKEKLATVPVESLSNLLPLAVLSPISLLEYNNNRSFESLSLLPLSTIDIKESTRDPLKPYMGVGIAANYFSSTHAKGFTPSIDLGYRNSKFAFGISAAYNFSWTNHFENKTYILDENNRLLADFLVNQDVRTSQSNSEINLNIKRVNFLSTQVYADYNLSSALSVRAGLGLDYAIKKIGDTDFLQDAFNEILGGAGTDGEPLEDHDMEPNGTMDQNLVSMGSNASALYSELRMSYNINNSIGISLGYKYSFKPFYTVNNLEFNTSRVQLGMNWNF